MLFHYVEEFGSDDVALHLQPCRDAAEDEAIAERLVGIFHAMRRYELSELPPEKRPNAGLWEMMKHEFHGPLYGLLDSRDIPGVAVHMSNALRRDTTWGLGPGEVVWKAMNTPGESRESTILLMMDRLAALGEAVGALPMENPEQGRYGVSLALAVSDIVGTIQQKIGEIHRPMVMGMFGLSVGENRVIDVRVPDDAYGAWRIQQLRRQYGLRTVCEIGAGFGGCAFQTVRSGLDEPYTIIDLPIVCLISGYFLMKIFGGDAVSMFGEPGPRRINVLPYWEFYNPEREFDLVYNRDSLPEMPVERAKEYLNEVERRRSTLISINQESGGSGGQGDLVQLNVNQLMTSLNRTALISRHPYWIRRGYVEELYRPL